MASRDLIHKLAQLQLLAPQDKAHTNWVSQILDTSGFESAVLAFAAGAFTGEDVNNYLTVSMTESDDTVGAHFTAVAATDVQAQGSSPNGIFVPGPASAIVVNSAAGANTTYQLGYSGYRRYIRLEGVYTGAGITVGLVGVNGLLSDSRNLPVVAPVAIAAS